MPQAPSPEKEREIPCAGDVSKERLGWGFNGVARRLLCHQLSAEALPFPWVSLFLLSKKLLSALVDRDELPAVPAASALFLFGDVSGLPGSAGAAVGTQLGHGVPAVPDPKTGRKRMGQARGIPGQGQQASSLRMQLIN